MVAGGRLCSEEEGLGGEVHVGVIPQLVIQVDDVQDVEQLALVLVEALYLDVENGVGIQHHAVLPGHIGGEAALVLPLDGLQSVQDGLVILVLLQVPDGIGMEEVVIPAGTLPNQSVQLGVDLGQPAAVVHAVGDVLELLRTHGVGVMEHILLQNIRVEGGDTVDGVAGAYAQIGHPDLAVPDDGHFGHLFLVAGEALLQLALVAGGDLLQDLPDPGQETLDQALGPALQRLGQDGVVGVGHRLGDDIPGVVPAVPLHIHQDTHQFGDDQSGMGVVDLEDVLLVEVAQGAILGAVLAHDGLDGSGDKEILLLQAQRLALVVVVIGIEHLGDDLSHGLLLHRLEILALGVVGHIHGDGALGVPEAQGIGVLGLIAGDLHIPGDGQDGGIAHMLRVVHPALVPVVHHTAAEADLLGLVHLGNEPGVAQAQPVVGLLHLASIYDLLLEDAQLIANRIAGGRDLQGGHGVQITGGQAAQTAVAQAGIRLLLKKIGGRVPKVLQRLLQGVQQTQIVGVLLQRAPHEKFHGQVVDLTLLVLPDPVSGLHLMGRHDVPQHQGAGLEDVVGTGILHVASEVAAEFSDYHLGKLGFTVFSHFFAPVSFFMIIK